MMSFSPDPGALGAEGARGDGPPLGNVGMVGVT